MNLEVRSFRNMVRWYGDELLYIHETSRKPSTINTRVAKRLVKKGFIERRKAHGYVLTERAIRVLKELKELGSE